MCTSADQVTVRVSLLIEDSSYSVYTFLYIRYLLNSSPGLTPRVIENTRDEDLTYAGSFNSPKQWKRNTEDTYNPSSPQQRFERNRVPDTESWSDGRHGNTERGPRLIPQPLSAQFNTDANITIDGRWVIIASTEAINEANFLESKIPDYDVYNY